MITTKPPKKITESMIQKACMDYLNQLPGCYAFRSSAGAIKTQAGTWFKTGRVGLPDICSTINGASVYFEIKTKVGKQSPVQKQAEKDIINAEGYYFIIRSPKELKLAIASLPKRSPK